jgi:prepilin-type N-terminal cleavage/methylation domain-containing protein
MLATDRQGFTMIELSIVLVIIGLLVAGILVGRDLIRTAELRGTVTQFDKINVAVNTFHMKYNAIPGDMAYANTAQFGFFTLNGTCGSGAGTTGCGDGNGLIDWRGASIGYNDYPLGEQLVFWRHLSDAGLIEGAFGSKGNGALLASGATTATVTDVSQSLPSSKVGKGMYFVVFSSSLLGTITPSGNRLVLLEVNSIDSSAAPAYQHDSSTPRGLTPIEAFYIDSKMDDGRPYSGKVVGSNALDPLNFGGFGAPPPAPSTVVIGPFSLYVAYCIDKSDGVGAYNMNSAYGGANAPACGISEDAQGW